jgi:hypothetical protein
MPRLGKTGILAAAGLAFALAAGRLPARAETPPAIEPEAAQTLRSALDRIARSPAFTYRAEITNDVPLPSGQNVKLSGTIEVAVRRPDGFWSAFDGEQRATRSWYDGKTFTLLHNGKNVYACWPATGSLDNLFAAMKERLGFTPPLTYLLREEVSTSALANASSGFTVGRSVIGGVPCRHLAFRGRKTDWQVWISETGEPVLKRLILTHREEPGAPQFSATFLAWDFAPRLTDGIFRFTPPPGAIQCEFEQLKP